jgi:RHS repeat-associated protein
MTYNSAGNLVTKTDFNGKTTAYGYDQNNRLTSKTPDPSFSAPAITFAYTPTGQRQSMVDPSGTNTYSYDLRDRLLSKATPQGTLTYTYDAAGNLASIHSSNTSGTSVNYAFDALNRLSTVTDNRLSSGITNYSYDAAGNLASYLYPNSVQLTYTYNTLNRLTNDSIAKGATTLASYAYTLGPTGNRTGVTELGGRQVDYTYDALYRLTGETIAGGAVNGSIGYTYDFVGNRQSRTSTVAPVPAATYSYDANDRLLSDTYDANGNTTVAGPNAYTYDFENHLTGENSGAVTIVYDGDGNRVSKTAGGVTTKYLIDDRNLTGYAQVLEEISGGTVPRVYTYGLNRISQSQASGTTFYGYDGHGNVRILTDATGVVTDRYDYDAFGNIIGQAGTTPNVYLYSGEQEDRQLALYYLRARYMNVITGRFWTMDNYPGRLFEPVSLHKYLYAGDNPTNAIDPSGRQYSLVELSLAGALLGATVGADLYSVTHTRTFQWLQFAKATGIGLVAGAGLGTAVYGGYYYLPAVFLFFSQPLSSSLEDALEKAASDPGPTVRIFTNLTQFPQAGRALYAAIGPYAQEVAASRAISGGQLYQADIPVVLYNLLAQNIFLARVGTVLMEDFAGTEVYFAPAITKYIITFFTATQ